MIRYLILGLVVCLKMSGQNSTGSISGTVADPNGAVIPAASITLISKATGGQRKMSTRKDGNYAFENLLPGEYEVRAGHEGFSSQTQTVTVVVGSTTNAAFSLQLGATSQVIEVTGTATTVNTTDIALGGVVDREQAENLPLNGRSFLSMAMLEPGVAVSYESESGPGNPNNFFQVSINGAPQQLTNISFDGARVNDRVTGGTSQNFSVESVQEFQVSTFNFDLSSGTVAAGAINVVSRTGTNSTHGAAFFYFRDHSMAAYPALRRDPFYPNPYFARKQLGVNLGGRIKRDRLFYYANYERTNQVGARTVVFTDPLLTKMNHVARQPFKGNLGAVRLDYRMRTNHAAFLRGAIDRNNSVTGTGIESGWVASSNFSYQSAMGVTSVLRNNMVNDLRFSYSYFRNWLVAPTEDACTAVSGNPDYCVGAGGPRVSFFGGLTIGNSPNGPQDRHPRTYQLTDNFNWTRGKHRIRFGGNWEHDFDHGSWSRNTTGTFGVYNPTQLAAQNPAIYDTLPSSLKIGSTTGPPALAELLRLPVAGAVTIGVGDPGQPPLYRQSETDSNDHIRFYIQDQWAIRRGLTINYGVGWSFENNVIYHNTVRSPFLYPLIGQQTGTVPYDWNNFDPAIGLAWAPGRSHKMVFRGGVSVHHSSPNVQFLKLNDAILNYPAGIGLTQSSSAGIANPRAGEAGMPATLNFNTPGPMTAGDLIALMPVIRGTIERGLRFNGSDPSIRNVEVSKTIQGPGSNDIFFDKSFRTPYTIHATAGFSREILPRTVMSLDYVMTRGVKFGPLEGMFVDLNRWNRFSGYNINASGTAALGPRNPVIPACVGTQAADPRALCSLGPVQYGYPGILSRYQALNVKVNKSFTGGLQFTGGFTAVQNRRRKNNTCCRRRRWAFGTVVLRVRSAFLV
ncbi:MAG: TonB-dependent receptor [Acidobacteria bacterium]|nr:TonB-dependent receptor [Acidobacteriota bacterium]